MLVLERFPGQRIVVNNDTVIEIITTSPSGKVKVGVVAPQEVQVHRSEVFDRIHGAGATEQLAQAG